MSISYFSCLFPSYSQIPKQYRMNLDSGFSVMNLICAPSLTKSNIDGFMHISIKVPETLSDCVIEKYFVSLFGLALRAKNVFTY